jgi:transcriptional regulator with XRE-family HTH domain
MSNHWVRYHKNETTGEELLEIEFGDKDNGRVCRTIRKEMGLSQSKVAELANVSVSYVSQIERNFIIPSENTFFAIIMALLLIPSACCTEEKENNYEDVCKEVTALFMTILKSKDMKVITYLRDVLQSIVSHFCQNVK